MKTPENKNTVLKSCHCLDADDNKSLELCKLFFYMLVNVVIIQQSNNTSLTR